VDRNCPKLQPEALKKIKEAKEVPQFYGGERKFSMYIYMPTSLCYL
jgi:hypothetical protein